MLPLIPFLILLAVFTAEFLISKYGLKWPGLFPFSVVLILVMGIYFVGKRKTQYLRYANKENDPRMVVGDYLSANFETYTRILTDQYVYVPPKLKEVDFSWGFTDTQLDSAEVVVINKKMYLKYLTPDRQIKRELSPEEHDIARNYARILFETPPWRRTYIWGGIEVFVKNN